jgi:hypothetical protein
MDIKQQEICLKNIFKELLESNQKSKLMNSIKLKNILTEVLHHKSTDESVNEAMISSSGAKGLKIGNKIKTENSTYTITGFGSQTNATKDFEATNEKGKKFNLRVSLRGATGIQVAPAPSLNFPEKEEMLESIDNEDYKYKKYVTKAFNEISDAMFEFRHSMGIKQLTNKDMKLKKKFEALQADIFALRREMKKDGLTEEMLESIVNEAPMDKSFMQDWQKSCKALQNHVKHELDKIKSGKIKASDLPHGYYIYLNKSINTIKDAMDIPTHLAYNSGLNEENTKLHESAMSLKSNINQKWQTADDMAGDMQQWLHDISAPGMEDMYQEVMNILENLVNNFDASDYE